MSKLRVLAAASDYIVGYMPEAQAQRLIRLRQARKAGDRAIRLMHHHEMPDHPCRTHTSRGGAMGAIGRSQQYTVAERDRVVGFKTIYPEDLHVFRQATLDCLSGSA